MRALVPDEVEYFLSTGRIKRPGWRTRAVVRWRRRRLDERLGAGQNPLADPLLAVRAGELADLRTRRRIADRLGGVADRFAGREPLTSAPVPPSPDGALSADATRRELLELADSLRAPWPVDERGVALAATLAHECSRALSHICAPALLDRPEAQARTRAAAREARQALERVVIDRRPTARPRKED